MNCSEAGPEHAVLVHTLLVLLLLRAHGAWRQRTRAALPARPTFTAWYALRTVN